MNAGKTPAERLKTLPKWDGVNRISAESRDHLAFSAKWQSEFAEMRHILERDALSGRPLPASFLVVDERAFLSTGAADKQQVLNPDCGKHRVGTRTAALDGDASTVVTRIVARIAQVVRVFGSLGRLLNLLAKIHIFHFKSRHRLVQIEALQIKRDHLIKRHREIFDDHRVFVIKQTDAFTQDRSRPVFVDQLLDTVEKSHDLFHSREKRQVYTLDTRHGTTGNPEVKS